LWSTASTSDTISNLCSGIYSVKITDANTCYINAKINLSVTVDSVITKWVHEDTCAGCSNGSVSVTIIGGKQNTIAWSDSTQTGFVILTNHTSDTITNLTAGVYVCVVTDSCGSSLSDTIRITQPFLTNIPQVAKPEDEIIVSPSPNAGNFSMFFKGTGYQAVIVFDEYGQKLSTTVLRTSDVNRSIYFNMEKYPDGIYLIQVINIKGVINKKVVISR
jgi:hypothetical protein